MGLAPQRREAPPTETARDTPAADRSAADWRVADRSAALRADVAARLRRVCAGMPAEAFDTLVDDICVLKLRWELDEHTRQRAD
jgi:hypothetical protein